MSDRAVSTDALATLGTLIGPNEKRDAIHLAVIPVRAGMSLKPGDHIWIDRDGLAMKRYGSADEKESLGVVDPFIDLTYPETIKPGQWFWLVIYPRKITSLRHVWSHPAFVDEAASEFGTVDQKEESRKYLEDFAVRLFSYAPDGPSRFEYLLEHAESGSFGIDIEYGPDTKPDSEFWFHYERYTGRKVLEANRHDWFSCGC